MGLFLFGAHFAFSRTVVVLGYKILHSCFGAFWPILQSIYLLLFCSIFFFPQEIYRFFVSVSIVSFFLMFLIVI